MRPISSDTDVVRLAERLVVVHRASAEQPRIVFDQDGRLLAGKNFTFEDDLADVESVPKKMGKRARGLRDFRQRSTR